MKKYIIGLLSGLIISATIGVYAAIKYQASEIEYNNTPLDEVLDDLYSKTNSSSNNKTCLFVSGNKGEVSSKYLCNLGDGIARYFYILKTDGNEVKLIMEKNLSDEVGNTTMSWNDAIAFFEEGHDGYNTKLTWKNVRNIDLPSAQDIADAGGITGWSVNTANSGDYYFGGSSSTRKNYSWLYNYTKSCTLYDCLFGLPDESGIPFGYWTNDLIFNDETNAWSINRDGKLGITIISNETYRGIRPVITISKSSLSN